MLDFSVSVKCCRKYPKESLRVMRHQKKSYGVLLKRTFRHTKRTSKGQEFNILSDVYIAFW
jgi:hypothetical protein